MSTNNSLLGVIIYTLSRCIILTIMSLIPWTLYSLIFISIFIYGLKPWPLQCCIIKRHNCCFICWQVFATPLAKLIFSRHNIDYHLPSISTLLGLFEEKWDEWIDIWVERQKTNKHFRSPIFTKYLIFSGHFWFYFVTINNKHRLATCASTHCKSAGKLH